MAKTVKIYLNFYLFLRKLLCSHRLPYDRSPEKIHRYRSSFPLNFRKRSGIKVFIDEFFSSKKPVVTWTSVFKTMQKFYAKSQKFSRSNSQTKKSISQNLSSLQKNLLETKITFLTALSQKCSPKTEKNLTLKVRKHIKKVFTDPTFISAKRMQFRKSCQKIKPIVSYSSALGLKIFKKFCFLYLKIISSFKCRLVT